MKYAVVLITNKQFSAPLNVVLFGLSKFNFLYDVIIFYDEYFDELELYKKIYTNLNIILCKINTEKYSNLKWTVNTRNWEINPFYRFEIFNLEEYDKILYLDLDVVILGSINEIFKIEGDFCAVELAKVTNLAYVPLGQRGFNAGVLLIGKKYLTKLVQDELIALSKCGVYNGNQKPLNTFFSGKVSFLDYKYNLTTDLLNPERIEEAKIIHFIGEQKPWIQRGTDAFCQYVKCIIGGHLLIKVYNLYKREQNQALQRLILTDIC